MISVKGKRLLNYWKPVLHNRSFMLLWIGLTTSTLGTAIYNIAVLWYIYRLTGSPLQVATLLLVVTLPALIFGIFSGILIDRLPQRTTLVAADLIRALCALAMIYASAPATVYVISFVLSTASQFFAPGVAATITRITDHNHLQQANSLRGLSATALNLLGPALGGFLVGWAGFRGPFILNALTFIVSAGCILALPQGAQTFSRGATQWSAKALVGDWVLALKAIHTRYIVFVVLVMQVILGLPIGINNALVVVLSKHSFGASVASFGILMSALAGGALFGSLIAGYLRDDSSRMVATNLALVGSGLGFIVFSQTHQILLAIALRVLIGFGLSVFDVTAITLLQEHIPIGMQGRVFSAYYTLDESAMFAFMALAGLFASYVGVQPMFLIAGLAILFAVFYCQIQIFTGRIQFQIANSSHV